MCEVFKALRSFEKLESLNFRCNKNFDDDIISAIAEGINLKKELRVSLHHQIFFITVTHFCVIIFRPSIWERTIYLTEVFKFWEMLWELTYVYTCCSWIQIRYQKRERRACPSAWRTSKTWEYLILITIISAHKVPSSSPPSSPQTTASPSYTVTPMVSVRTAPRP